ncbi:hypothetical protein OCH239_18500 [Roseivivax halodurans JCM 10272]|uniref:Uncharacterized protein n=1 Tax=Roseivivax halodurans JCM 10272 TaxID=1449350 RepID=X7EJF2_9RHOB|nr:hypothetical protein OCH239_18500 [Roseivivax halodurans JCM 10272]
MILLAIIPESALRSFIERKLCAMKRQLNAMN